jgi:TolB-like protein/DNA-binding SARP family transcriptional activator/Tfp pilus assembly protein PilF
VSDTPVTPHPAPHYRLATFGTLGLVGPADETVLGTHGHHRRRLALLAVLAAAGERGRSRDQLLGLFWPESTQSRARHALEQLLYSLRSSISDSVFASSNPVRLDPDVVESDVAAFNAALARADLEAAVEQYKGSFLDGFYLDDAAEFERWVESERTRLAAAYADALDRLAQRADTARDYVAAVRWRRKLTEVDALSSKNATGLIRALMNAGDHAAALQYAERYEAAVAESLGTSVGPVVASLVAEVRAKAASDPVAASRPMSAPPPARPPASPVAADNAPASAGSTPAADRQPNGSAPTNGSRRRLTPFAIGALAVAALIATAAVLRATLHARGASAPADPSIAVLPLANVSRNPQDAALIDGLTEELIGVLARVSGLRVTARTSAFMFRNSSADVRRIADSLGVSYILEGGVQRADSQVRVDVRLIDAREGSTRWSQTYDRTLRDIFAVQTDIAGEVARELDVQLGGTALARVGRAPTPDIAAYELYLRGNDPALVRSDSAARIGLDYFRRAIALDSMYAAAYAGVSRMHIRLARGGDTTMSLREHLALADAAARRAVALNDSLAEAHAALGLVRRENLDLSGAETELLRAVALEPRTARFHLWLGQIYDFKRPAEALTETRRALALDPLAPNANAEFARALFINGRCDDALVQLAKLRGLQPPLLRLRSIAAQCYARQRMWPEAIAEARENTVSGGVPARGLLGYVLARAGHTDDARRILDDMLAHAQRVYGGAFEVAEVYAGLDDKDQAFAWLDRAVDERTISFEHLPIVLDALASDPRIDGFRRRLGIQQR